MAKKFNQSAMNELMGGLVSSEEEAKTVSESTMLENSEAEETSSHDHESGEKRGSTVRTKSGGIRVSIIVQEKSLDKVKYIMEKENFKQSQIFDAALSMLIKKYEEKKGPIKPRQRKKQGNISDLFDI